MKEVKTVGKRMTSAQPTGKTCYMLFCNHFSLVKLCDNCIFSYFEMYIIIFLEATVGNIVRRGISFRSSDVPCSFHYLSFICCVVSNTNLRELCTVLRNNRSCKILIFLYENAFKEFGDPSSLIWNASHRILMYKMVLI